MSEINYLFSYCCLVTNLFGYQPEMYVVIVLKNKMGICLNSVFFYSLTLNFLFNP